MKGSIKKYGKENTVGASERRDKSAGALHSYNQSFLPVGICPQYSGCTEQALSGCAGDYENQIGPGTGGSIRRIFPDGAACRCHHQTLGLPHRRTDGTSALWNGSTAVHSGGLAAVLRFLPVLALRHRLRTDLPGNSRQSVCHGTGRTGCRRTAYQPGAILQRTGLDLRAAGRRLLPLCRGQRKQYQPALCPYRYSGTAGGTGLLTHQTAGNQPTGNK